MGSVVPFFGLLGWGAAMVLGYLILKKWEREGIEIKTSVGKWALRAVPGLVAGVFGIISIFWAEADFTIWTGIAFAGCIPASVLAFNLRAFGEETLPLQYGVEEIRSSDVGKKVSDMVGFRKASFNEIGGLEDVKREVKNALMVPLLEPDMATKYGVKPSKGMLLFGPPGCGKTLMLRAVASDLNVEMIGVKCSDVMSKWYGESEGLIASLFEEARAKAPCILFLDEIDAIAKRRDFYSTDDVTPRVLSIMLSEMDGMDEAEGIIVVATTNMPDLVDPALMRPGRFDKIIYVPPPEEDSRREILKIHLKGKFASEDIDIDRISKMTSGFSGADLANLVREASSLGLERALETRKPQPITMKDMEEILDEIKPSISGKMIKMYDKLRREYERKKKGGSKGLRDDTVKTVKGSKMKKSTPPPPPEPSTKKNERDLDISDMNNEIDELGEWEGS
jgi:AAA+ superfamily predicted ATPase